MNAPKIYSNAVRIEAQQETLKQQAQKAVDNENTKSLIKDLARQSWLELEETQRFLDFLRKQEKIFMDALIETSDRSEAFKTYGQNFGMEVKILRKVIGYAITGNYIYTE